MASRSRRGGGGGGGLQKGLWFLVVAGLIFAFFQIPYDPGVKGITGILQSKAEHVKVWVEGIVPGIQKKVEDIIKGGSSPVDTGNPGSGTDYGTPGSGGTGTTPDEAKQALKGVVVAAAQKVDYNRDDWNHWVDARSCWTVREAVLARDAQPGSLVLKDKAGNTTSDVNVACEIVSGVWIDPYSGSQFTNPRDMDIDHMIPLKYAATHGGQAWDKPRKEAYANSMEGTHLLAVSASENRSKSDKGPGSWKPSNTAYYCDYAQSWVKVSTGWGLSVDQKDYDALDSMLQTCS